MAASLAELRKKAKGLGIPAVEIKAATSSEELQQVIAAHGSGGAAKKKSGSAVAKKKSGNSAAKKKSGGTKSKSAPAKSKTSKTGAKAKRPTAAKSNGYVPKGGRNVLEGINFSNDDGWNARAGSAPDRIIKALKKAKGNREKAFDALVGDLWDFVGKKMRDGSKRSKADAESMLRYRIARTLWDFAIKTGQHDVAENRVEYGTGGTGTGSFKRKKSGTAKAKTTAAKSKSKAKAGAKKSGSKRKK